MSTINLKGHKKVIYNGVEHKRVVFNGVEVWASEKDIVSEWDNTNDWTDSYKIGYATLSSWGVNPLNIYVESTASSVEGYAGLESAGYIDLTDYSKIIVEVESALIMKDGSKLYAPELDILDKNGAVVRIVYLDGSTVGWTGPAGCAYTRENFACTADISSLSGEHKLRLRIGCKGAGNFGAPKIVHVSINSMKLLE